MSSLLRGPLMISMGVLLLCANIKLKLAHLPARHAPDSAGMSYCQKLTLIGSGCCIS